jgi:pimeloyl-[acyl-carrier protein] methyl ester esterase
LSVALAVHRHGIPEGPKLVLLHGWALDARVFEPLIVRWRARYSIEAVDLPGHGVSPWTLTRSDIAAWAQQVAAILPDQAIVIGWSLGAMIALELARSQAAKISRLILIAGTPRFTCNAAWPMGASAASVDRLAALLHANYRRMVKDFIELQVRGSQDAAAAIAQLQRASAAPAGPNIAALDAGLDLLRSTDLIAALPSIRQPTLVVAGELDRIVMPAASERLAALMPNAHAALLRRAAHAPFLSHADEFADLAESFIESAQAA